MMSRLLYYLVIKPLSWLPLNVLYVLSDFFYLVLYKGFKYRQKVVRNNLVNSFPGKSIKEIIRIEQELGGTEVYSARPNPGGVAIGGETALIVVSCEFATVLTAPFVIKR